MQTSVWTPPRDGDREHDHVRGLDYVWRPEVGRKSVGWMERNLRHVKGPSDVVGTPLKFAPWQEKYLMALYGWRVRGREGQRRPSGSAGITDRALDRGIGNRGTYCPRAAIHRHLIANSH